jgi:hypothetical protein
MSLRVQCPNCRAVYALADDLAGANICCKACQKVFQANGIFTAVAPVRRQIKARAAVDQPPRDRPRRQPMEEEKSGSIAPMLLIILGVAACLLLGIGIALIGAAILWPRVSQSSTPDQAWQDPEPDRFAEKINAGPDRFDNDNAGNKLIPADKFGFIQQKIKERRLIDVDITGFTLAKRTYREAPDEGGILIGLQAGFVKAFGSEVVDGLRALYWTKNGEKAGSWYGNVPVNPVTVKAKPGYVVTAVNSRMGLRIDAFSLQFAKLGNERLMLEDSYDSNWVGGSGGNARTIGGRGDFYVGICGHLNDQGVPCSLGLIAVADF